MVKAMQPEDYSHSTITVSHPGIDSNHAEVLIEFRSHFSNRHEVLPQVLLLTI